MHQCMPFQGTIGELMGALLGTTALLIYTLIWKCSPKDGRTSKMFALDLAKIAISGSFAWGVNLGIARMSSKLLTHSHHLLQGIAWYAAVMLTDSLIGVPLGVLLGKRFEAWCRHRTKKQQEELLGKRLGFGGARVGGTAVPDSGGDTDDEASGSPCACTRGFVRKNATFGKYWPDRETAKVVAASKDELSSLIFTNSTDEYFSPPPRRANSFTAVEMEKGRTRTTGGGGTFSASPSSIFRRARSSNSIDRIDIPDLPFVPTPRWDWWLAQLVSWSVCVVLSRILSGVVMVVVAQVLGNYDPALIIAELIHHWDVPCATKQLVIAGALRVVLDVVQIGFIDVFNHFDLYTAIFAELQ